MKLYIVFMNNKVLSVFDLMDKAELKIVLHATFMNAHFTFVCLDKGRWHYWNPRDVYDPNNKIYRIEEWELNN